MTAVQRAGRRRALPTRTHFKKLSAKQNAATSKKAASDPSAELSEDPSGLQIRVQQLVDTFKFEEAREVCAKAVALTPEDADLQYLMGTICLEIGDFVNGFEVRFRHKCKLDFIYFVAHS
jgi:Flp pilus assembly protein TadD